MKTKDKDLNLHSFSSFSVVKNRHLEVELSPGSYTVVPITTGCRMQPQRTIGKFGEMTKLIDEYGIKEQLLSVIKDIFAKYDLLMNRELNYKETSFFFKDMGLSLSEPTFWELVARYNEPFRTTLFNGLTLKGFIHMWQDMIIRDGEDRIY